MSNGDLVTCGSTSGLTDFDPSGQTYLIDASRGINFLARYSANGLLQWAVNFDSTSYLAFQTLVSDGNNFIYVCGYFNGIADMDPSSDTLILRSGGVNKIFFAKYNATNGSLVWAKMLSNNNYISSLSFDSSQNLFLAGNFTSTIDLDPDTGSFTLIPHPLSDIYVSKYDTAGNFISAVSFGGNNIDQFNDMTTDQQNNIYITGIFRDTVDFDPGAGMNQLINSIPAAFILKLDANLQFKKVIQFTGNTSCTFSHIRMDKNNNLLLGGSMGYGTIDLDAGPDTANITWPPFATSPSICTRQDTGLNHLSSFIIPTDYSGSTQISIQDIAADTYNNIYFEWSFAYDVDLDPGPGTVIYNSVNNSFDILLGKYSASGQLLWSFNLGSPLDENPGFLLIGKNNKMYTGGFFKSQMDVDPSATVLDVINTNFPGSDGILVCYDQCTAITNTVNASICNGGSYLFNGDTLISSGIYFARLNSSSFCDSVVTLNLNVSIPVSEVSLHDTAISSNAIGASYQWFNCSNNIPINGATNKTFHVPDNNAYSVIVSQNGCTDTSTCIQIYENANKKLPKFDWAHILPYKQYEGNDVLRIGINGNIYLAGYIDDTANFDFKGGSSHYLEGVNGHTYMTLAKYDKDKNYIWAFALGSPSSSGPYPEVLVKAMTLDSADNIYVTGRYSETFDIDPGPGTTTMDSNGDYYLAKYNASGQFQWVVTLFNSGGTFEANSLFLDKSGHLYLGGNSTFNTTIVTPTGSNSVTTSGPQTSLFLAQFDANTGSYLWSFVPPSAIFSDNDLIDGTVDNYGNIIVTGTFSCPTDFDPDTGTTILNPNINGTLDAFVAKYSPTHDLLWVKKKNSICEYSTYYGSFNVVVDSDNKIYVCGSCSGAYLDQYSDSGIVENSFRLGGQQSHGRDLAIDETNNIYILTSFTDSCIVGEDTIYSYSAQSNDLVFSKFNKDGTFGWSAHLGSSGYNYGNVIDVDRDGNIYLKGIYEDTLDADIDPSTSYNLISSYRKPFLIKYGQSCAPVDTAMISDSTNLSARNTTSYYVWINCATGMPVPGQHNSSLNASVSGDYKAVIYQGDCVDTSACYFVSSLNEIKENKTLFAQCSPNPVIEQWINIKSNEIIKSVSLSTISGVKMHELEIISGKSNLRVNIGKVVNGIYLLQISGEGGKSTIKKIVVLQE